MAKNQNNEPSPLAKSITDRVLRIIRGAPEIVAAEYGMDQEVSWSKTTVGDNPAERRTTRARNRLRGMQQSSSDRSRRRRYSDYREMLDEVPEVATALQVMIDFVFGGHSASSIEIVFKEEATEAMRATVEGAWQTIGGSKFFVDVFKEGSYLGDSFTEMIYSKSGLVAERPLNAGLAEVQLDKYGQLRGYTVSSGSGSSIGGQTSGYTLTPIQVLHYAPDKMRGNRYGRSMWASARKLWRQAEAAEDVMSLLSLLQASARKSVAFPLPTNIRPDQVDTFLESMRGDNWSQTVFDKDGKMRRRITSLLAMDDLIYPYREGQDKPTFHNEPAADLNQLIDVLRYLQEKYFIAAGVPAALCGFERNVNSRATLEQQGLQFVRTVQRKQQEVIELVISVLVRAVAAAGLTPAIDFEVRMPPVSSFDDKLRAEIAKLHAETARILGVDMGLNMRYVLSSVLNLSDEEVAMVVESIELGRLAQSEADIETTKRLVQDHVVGDVIESIADMVSGGRGNGYGLFTG